MQYSSKINRKGASDDSTNSLSPYLLALSTFEQKTKMSDEVVSGVVAADGGCCDAVEESERGGIAD